MMGEDVSNLSVGIIPTGIGWIFFWPRSSGIMKTHYSCLVELMMASSYY